MANMLCRTTTDGSPKGKPRIYFTCHPQDLPVFLDRILEDIFRLKDCAVYYTEDMAEPIPAEDRSTDIGTHNLVVVPVTRKLLTQPNRAMDEDIPYALQEHIPVLPLVMEPGLEQLYSHRFGKLQYLQPDCSDDTQVSYRIKLNNYLESGFVSSETVPKIHNTFDGHIFLSYRKKDRRYANELMRLIHNQPGCQDIAIWYDEFLTPGRSFEQSISQQLTKSKLVILLVTPNLLEEPEGNPNFVMAQEYPAARNAGIPILPVEMEATDRDALAQKYPGLPDCADLGDEKAFRTRLLQAVSSICNTQNNADPEHLYLTGLAYMAGIDMEVDRKRGLELITAAAEKNHPEAISALWGMYSNGHGVRRDYGQSAQWAKKLMLYRMETAGAEDPATISAMHKLAITYYNMGSYESAFQLLAQEYALLCRLRGEEDPDSITVLGNMASSLGSMGKWSQALELQEKKYRLSCKVRGREDPKTWITMNNLANTLSAMEQYDRAAALLEEVHTLQAEVLGRLHPDTLTTLHNLATVRSHQGQYEKAIQLLEQVLTQRRTVLGPLHPNTLTTLGNLAAAYGDMGDYEKELELQQDRYEASCEVLGKQHPDTLLALQNLAVTLVHLERYREALPLQESAYSATAAVLGPFHPRTLLVMSNLASTYYQLDMPLICLEFLEKLYTSTRRLQGRDHPDTLKAREDRDAVRLEVFEKNPILLELWKWPAVLWQKWFSPKEE